MSLPNGSVQGLLDRLVEPNDSFLKALTKEFLLAAITSKSNAYCPYSEFRVGAAVLALPTSSVGSAETPKLFTGVNVENASYPVGLCAERCAISTAVAAGFSRITAIAVSTDAKPPASPCGMCRQFMREFVVDGQVPIIMIGGDGIRSEFTAKSFEELLPMSFGPENLGPRD